MKTINELFEENKGSFAVDVGTVHHFSDGLYAKQMHLPKGYVALSHTHCYNHLSILGKGKVVVSTDTDDSKEYTAPACIEIKKGVHHSIEALEDAIWFCIHATDETDVENVDKVLIEEK